MTITHTSSRSIGFIAPQVKHLFSELVQYHLSDKIRLITLKYDGFSVSATKGVQEQQAFIIDQQTELDSTKQKLEDLEAKYQTQLNLIKSMKNENN